MLVTTRNLALLLACLSTAPSLVSAAPPQLPILQCSLVSAGNPNGPSPVMATGNIILEDVNQSGGTAETSLGLIPSSGFTNFQITGAVYGYQLSSGDVHALLQIFLDGEVQDTKIFDIATGTHLLLEQEIKGIKVSLTCLPRNASAN